MLSAIVAVTLFVPDVDAVQRAYERTLAYETVQEGTVDADTARTWGRAALAGRELAVLRPASGEPVYIRLVESDAPPRAPLRTLGWNATEILVEDPPALEQRLQGSPFRVIGPPAPLDFNPAVVAMQALGPAGELLYFTRIPPGKSKFSLGSARTFVDRVFIVVLGVHDIRRTLDFYATTFGLEVTDPAPSRVGILAQAWNRPADEPFTLAIVRLPERFLIEVDEYPAEAAVIGTEVAAGPPAGMAMVSFTVDSLEPHLDALIGEPRVLRDAPYGGRRVGVTRGPSGEYLELIEGPPPSVP